MTLKLDPFGIGAAQFMALDLHENASRASGRTQFILNAVKPGEAIVFPDSQVRNLHRHYLEGRGLKIVTEMRGNWSDAVLLAVIDPRRDHRKEMGTNPFGRTFLSHEYVLATYRHALRWTAKSLQQAEEDLSSSHPATADQASRYHRGLRMNEIVYAKHPL